MATNPATTDDLAARWHPYPYADDATGDAAAQTRLDAAWRALVAELPSVSTRLDAGALTEEDVIDVLCDAAMRVLQNPDGFTEMSASLDDYSESGKTDPQSRSNDMYFTRAELRRLSPALRGAFTITPGVR